MRLYRQDSKKMYIVKLNGIDLVFSYSTLVALRIGKTYYRCKEYHSRTTQAHINDFMRMNNNDLDNIQEIDDLDKFALNALKGVI